MEKMHADHGSQFTSGEFQNYCHDTRINLVIAAPKKQYQNHIAERMWQTVSTMARSLLTHARLPDTFWYHALQYATHIFNVLLVKGFVKQEEVPSTPYELMTGQRPLLSRFRVFGCPSVVQRWVSAKNTNGKQTERGVRGIFIGFDHHQKGYLIFAPGSRHILLSGDVTFNESFHSAIATTWQQQRDSLALQPLTSYVPDITTDVERTGDITDLSPSTTVEEGRNN
jgi:hypothetical protein